MRLTEGNWAPETDAQGVVNRQVSANGPVEEAAGGSGDAAGILARGGSNPAATDPGLTDTGATGGGRAVPDAGAFENQGGIGDNQSFDDGAGLSRGGGRPERWATATMRRPARRSILAMTASVPARRWASAERARTGMLRSRPERSRRAVSPTAHRRGTLRTAMARRGIRMPTFPCAFPVEWNSARGTG